MPVLKDRHVVISRARNGREIYDTVCEWLNTTNYFKWTDDSVSYNNELEELDRKRRMLLLRRKISECGCVVLFAEMYGNYKEWIDRRWLCLMVSAFSVFFRAFFFLARVLQHLSVALTPG